MTRADYAKAYGVTVASNMFVYFTNEKNRGPKFKWSNFPSMVKRLAIVNLFTSLVPSPTKAEELLAGDAAESWAENAIAEADLCES
jgi:hypothetical protein